MEIVGYNYYKANDKLMKRKRNQILYTTLIPIGRQLYHSLPIYIYINVNHTVGDEKTKLQIKNWIAPEFVNHGCTKLWSQVCRDNHSRWFS